MNENIIPKDLLSDGFRGAVELMPLAYVIIVVMTVLAFSIVRFDGTTVKRYRLYVVLIGSALAGVAYHFYPEKQVKVRDIPTLIIGLIASLFAVQLFIYWRKKKTNK